MAPTTLLKRIKLFATRRWLLLSIAGIFIISSWLSVHALKQVQREAADTECRSNIFFLGHLLLEFGEFYGCLPPPFISDQAGKPLYSWRVLMLSSVGHGHAPLHDEFDFCKPWNDPSNLNLCKGKDKRSFMLFFSCPTTHPENIQADYFYALSSQYRWPRDFFYDYKSAFRPAHILLVESQACEVHWSEPIDVVYQEPGLEGLLAKTADSKSAHQGGTHCYTSDGAFVTIPPDSTPEHVLQDLRISARAPRTDDASIKGQIDRLVARLMDILGERDRVGVLYSRQNALLLLGELGPLAKAAVPMIRRVIGEGAVGLRPIAALALAKIEK
jgi:hypothetical protein